MRGLRLMDNIEAIIVRADLSGNLSQAAQAAVQDLARLEAAASKAQRSTADIGEGAQRASAGFSALEARLDSNVRLTNAKAAADARLAREIETITRATEANAAAQVRANALIESATRNRDAYIARVRQDIAATEQRTARVLGETGALTQFGAANDNAAQSSGRMRMALGQAGFQVQDFATQVSMGQNALMAFGVQGAQLAGVFGPTGAIAGAALMIGVIGAQLLGLGESSSAAEARIRVSFDGIKAESVGVRDLIKEIGDLFKTAADRAAELALAQRTVLSQNADLRLSNAVQLQDAAGARMPELERTIRSLERQAEVEERIARTTSRGSNRPVDQTTDITARLFEARAQLAGVRAEMDLQSRRIGDLNTARSQLAAGGSDQGAGQYGPPSPQAIEQTRVQLDRQYALRREHAERIASINGAMTRGEIDAADATGLRTAAERALADGLKALTDRQTGANQAIREYNSLQRDASGLLVQSESDTRAIREVNQQIRGTAIDPAVVRRETERAATEAQRAMDEAARTSTQAANTIESNFSGAFTRAFEAGANAGQSFLTSIKNGVKSLAATIASQLVFRMAVVPVVNAGASALGYGGSLISAPNSPIGGVNLGGILGGASGVSTAGSVQGGVNQAGQSMGLMSAGRYGNLGAAFTGQGLANTGFGVVDGALNTPIFGSGAAMQGPTISGAPVSGIDGLTVGGGIGAGASILGGAYGIYQGAQKGGIGGAAGMAGGAAGIAGGVGMLGASGALGAGAAGLFGAAGALSFIPVYGWIAAAILSIVGAMLPGEKASGKGQTAFVNVDDGNVGYAGLGGDRFSQDNRDSSQNAAEQIASMARRVGDALGGAQFGSHVAVGTTSSRGDGAGKLYLDVAGRKGEFTNDEAGSKALAEEAGRLIVRQFREANRASGDYKSILDSSGDSVEALTANLDWYEKIYKTFDEATPKVSAFQQSLDALNASFQPNIDKAAALGLSVEPVTAARGKGLVKLEASRWERAGLFDQSLEQREMRLRGDNLGADLITFDQQAKEQLEGVKTALEDLGLTGEEFSKRYARNEQILADERLAIQKRYADEAAAIVKQAQQDGAGSASGVITNLRGYVTSLATGEASSGTAMDRFTASQRQFDAVYGAARAGDANSISGLQGAAETFRTNARDIFGGGQGYADALRLITDRISGIGGLGAEALTQSFVTDNARKNTDRVVDQLAALRADINMLLLRPAA